MDRKTEKISDAELEVLKILWIHNESMTERQIIDALHDGSGWHRATIQTLIRRLCKKGVVQKEKKDVFYFSAVVSEKEYAQECTADLLNRVYGGYAKNLVSAMLNDNILSEQDIDDLKSYWQEKRNEK